MDTFIDEARSFLKTAGYDPALLCADYEFTWREPQGNLVNSALPLVAFSGSPATLRTACVSVFISGSDDARQEQLSKLRFLASPIAIVKTGNLVSLWAVRHEGNPEKIATADHANWQSLFQSRAREMTPEAVFLSKLGGRQLSFVDAGLVEWAERITEQTLTTLIEEVLHSALGQHKGRSAQVKHVLLRLVFQLFACRVLEDKGVIPKQETARKALKAAHERFSENIDPAAALSSLLPISLVSTVFTELRTRFSFSSLTTEMLGHVYENALVTPEFRQENGIFYTPRSVTSYILKQLPIESIPEEKRVLLDPCCGSGSFLLAGFDRLDNLLGSSLSPAKKHQYLRARLRGFDIDEFAIETAILSLVVRDPLNRNGWKISLKNVSDLGQNNDSQRPTIIVTNPPFKEIKEHGTRREFATEVLGRATSILERGGLMGIVLPQSMLESRTASGARRAAMQECDILEILTLPGGLFYSNADTAVLLMRKKIAAGRLSHKSITVRELHAQDLPRFRSAAGFTATYSVESGKLAADPESRFVLSPFLSLWERLEAKNRTLDYFCVIRSGLQVKKTDTVSVSEKHRSGDVKFVNRLDVLRPYALLVDTSRFKPMWLRYGPQLRRSGDREIFESSKVLVNSNRNPGSPWRLVAAPAPPSLYFSDNFHGIMSKSSGLSIHVITAILNSPVANAWFHAYSRKRKIVQETLGRLPMPEMDDAVQRKIEDLTKRIEEAVITSTKQADEGLFYEGSYESAALVPLVSELDQLVYNAYNLSSAERRSLDLFMTSGKRPS